MSRPVCITYDSTCDLTTALLERFKIRTVSLTIQSGERVFPDDGQYTSAELYAEYRRNGTLPKTAAVSPEDFKAFFAPILAEGYDIVHIDISSELSCTCQNAVLAAQELAEQGQIHVVDSRQLSTGGGLLAWTEADGTVHASTAHCSFHFTEPVQGGLCIPKQETPRKCTVYAIDPAGQMLVGDVTV